MEDRPGVSGPPPRRRRKIWKRLLQGTALLFLLLLLLYLLRNPLFGGPLRNLLARTLTRELKLPLSIGKISGSWVTGVELGKVRSGKPHPRGIFRKLELDRLQIRYSLAGLLLGRPDWLESVRVQGLILRLDLDREKGLPSRPGPPPRPFPAWVWRLRPEVTADLRDFTLHVEGRDLFLRKGSFHMAPSGECRLQGRSFSPPYPPGEEGPLDLRFTRRGPRLTGIRGRAARVVFTGTEVDFSRFPGNLAFHGRITHPWGKVEFQARLDSRRLDFQVRAREIAYQGAALFLPAGTPRLFDSLPNLKARGGIDLEDPLESDLSFEFTLEGGEKALFRQGSLAGTARKGALRLSRSRLIGPGAGIEASGNLERDGTWRARLSAAFQGRLAGRVLSGLPALSAASGKAELVLSGRKDRPREGRLSCDFRDLALPGHPPLRKIQVQAELLPEGTLRIGRALLDLAGGEMRVQGEIRPWDRDLPWKGRAQGEELDPAFFLGRGKEGSLSFIFDGEGGARAASFRGGLSLRPRFPGALPPLDLEAAGLLAWGKGWYLHPWKIRGRLGGRPFRLAAQGAFSTAEGTLRLPPAKLSAPGLEISVRGTFPPEGDGKEALLLEGLIRPGEIPVPQVRPLLSLLERAGFNVGPGSAALPFTFRAGRRGGDLLFRGARAGAPVLEASWKEAGRESLLAKLRIRNLRQADQVRAEGILPLSWRRILEGRLPSPAEDAPLYLLGRITGLRGSTLPGRPFHGKTQALFLLDGTLGSPGTALLCSGRDLALPLSLGEEGKTLRKGWTCRLAMAWREGDLRVAGEGKGPLELSLRLSGEAHTPRGIPGDLPEWLRKSASAPLSLEARMAGDLAGLTLGNPVLSGRLEGRLSLAGTLLRPEASLTVRGRNLSVRTLGNGIRVEERMRSFDLEARASRGFLEGTLRGEFRKNERLDARFRAPFRPSALLEGREVLPPGVPLDLRTHARGFRLSRLAPFLPFPCELNGRLSLEGSLEGTWKEPRPRGSLILREGLLKLPASFPALEGVEGRIRVSPEKVEIREFRARAAGGELSLKGTLSSPLSRPGLDLSLKGKEVLLVRTDKIRARGDLDLRLRGSPRAPLLEGRVLLTSGRFRARLPVLQEGIQAATRAAQDFPSLFRRGGIKVERTGGPLFSLETPPLSRTRFDVRIGSKEPFRVETNVFRAPLLLDMNLRGTGKAPLLLGQVTTLEKGRIFLPGINLDIRALRLYFDPSDPYMPRLQLACQGRRHSVTVRVNALGPLDDLRMDLSSSPPHSRKDLVTLLATGTLPRSGAGGRAALGTLGSYLGSEVLGYISGGGEESWLEKRLTLEIGTEVGPSGTENIVAEFLLTPGVYLQGERDVMGYYDLGLLFRWSLR